MNANRINSKGFTLLEVMVAVLLMSMIGTVILALATHTLSGWSSGTSKVTADNTACVAIQKISQDIRLGSQATTTGTELTVTVPPLVTDANGEKYYDPSQTGTTYRYYVSNNSLYRKIGTAAATLFVRDVSSTRYSVSTNIVTMTITSQCQTGSGKIQRQNSDSIVLRNYKG